MKFLLSINFLLMSNINTMNVSWTGLTHPFHDSLEEAKVYVLAQKAKPNAWADCPIFEVISEDRTDMLDVILNAKAPAYPINECRKQISEPIHFSPIHWAIRKSRLKSMRCLLHYGSNINLSTQSDYPEGRQTPLHLAIDYPITNNAILHLLLHEKANLDTTNGMGLTPYQYALKYSKTDAAGIIKQWKENDFKK